MVLYRDLTVLGDNLKTSRIKRNPGRLPLFLTSRVLSQSNQGHSIPRTQTELADGGTRAYLRRFFSIELSGKKKKREYGLVSKPLRGAMKLLLKK